MRMLGNGTGPATPTDAARAVVLIRANNLARGHSAVRRELLELLLQLLNEDITPMIPEEGSVGASGDLVPLSYVAAALTGTRMVEHRGTVRPSADALRDAGLTPLVLEPKEGLALVNGTAFMAGIAALATIDARRVALVSDVCTAMATEVLNGIVGPFQEFIHDIAKPHPGQVRSARHVRTLLEGSQLARPFEEVVAQAGTIHGAYRELEVHIQDKYSLRCAPHFTGRAVGRPHVGRAMARHRDQLEQRQPAVRCGLWKRAERRQLLRRPRGAGDGLLEDGDRQRRRSHGPPARARRRREVQPRPDANLIAAIPPGDPEEGLNHGFKGMQLACSSLTADALSRCMPLSVFSRSTECHNQDKVSMGATAARQARDVVALTEKVAAIHLLALCQAADLRGPDKLGRTRLVYERVRAEVPFVATDRPMADDVGTVLAMLRSGSLTQDLVDD